MSNIIEKITLYDILGYTVPGTIFLLAAGLVYLVSGKNDIVSVINTYGGYAGYFFTGLVLAGYLTGMIISEITDFLAEWIRQWKWYRKKNEVKDIDGCMIAKALKKAGAIRRKQDFQNNEECIKKYMGFMYGQVQSNTKYSRLHNYASTELICKNMAFVALACAAAASYLLQNFHPMIGGCICSYLFLRRWRNMCWRKSYYVVVWFIEIYLCKQQVG